MHKCHPQACAGKSASLCHQCRALHYLRLLLPKLVSQQQSVCSQGMGSAELSSDVSTFPSLLMVSVHSGASGCCVHAKIAQPPRGPATSQPGWVRMPAHDCRHALPEHEHVYKLAGSQVGSRFLGLDLSEGDGGLKLQLASLQALDEPLPADSAAEAAS